MIHFDEVPASDGRMDAVILAGGKLPDDLARRSESVYRALLPHEGRPTVMWTIDAVRASEQIGRVAVVGPGELGQIPAIAGAELFMPESDSMESNLFTVFARLLPEGRIFVTSCDCPLITAEAIDDFISRSAPEAAVNLPVIRHDIFLRKFPRAPGAPVQLKDGSWLHGNCGILNSRSIPRLQRLLPEVFKRRADLRDLIAQLGWKFAWKLKMKRVTLAEVQDKVCDAAGLPVRFIRDSDPSLAFDIDTVEQWTYLQRWAVPTGSRV